MYKTPIKLALSAGILAASLLGASLFTPPASAQQPGHGAHHHAHSAPAGDQSEASLALQEVNERMHREMAIAFTGDPDVDFVRGMIAHHQGAIDMAQVVLTYGEDPEIRALAEAIIEAQEEEIAMMRDWLARNESR